MDRVALEALALRVEQAAGPDRELDAAIAATARAGLPSGCDWAFKFPKWEGERFGRVRIIGNVNGNGDYISGHFVSPAYTASLDAAMTLVPTDHTIQLSDWEHELLRTKGAWQAIVLPIGARGRMTDYTFSNRCDHAATPALALTAACLRAAASLAREPGEGDRHG